MNRTGAAMVAFRTFLVAAWLVMMPITIHAIAAKGVSGLGVFLSDFDSPWRAQINADFSVHLCLVMAWIVFREGTPIRGVMFALPVLLGSVYLLPYLFAASFGAGGRFDTLLLGQRRHGSKPAQC
jgi:hypothetical protein